MMQKGKRWVVNMKTEITNSVVSFIQSNIDKASEINSLIDDVECTCKKDNQITESVRIMSSVIYEYLETSIKEINNTAEENLQVYIDEFTLPICIAKELSETLLLLVKNFNSGSHILSSKMKLFRTLAKELKHLYEIEVNKLVDELTDPSGPEGKVS